MEKFGQAHRFNLYSMPFIEEQNAPDAPTSLVNHLCPLSKAQLGEDPVDFGGIVIILSY